MPLHVACTKPKYFPLCNIFLKTPAACKVDAKQKLWSKGKVLTLWIRPAEWMYCL